MPALALDVAEIAVDPLQAPVGVQILGIVGERLQESIARRLHGALARLAVLLQTPLVEGTRQGIENGVVPGEVEAAPGGLREASPDDPLQVRDGLVEISVRSRDPRPEPQQ